MDHKSPLDNIFNIIGGLPQGHDKPIKHALYNAVAHFILFVCCAALWALYFILQPFLKPLVWALLVGSVLHPFKYSLAQRFNSWFANLDDSQTPIIVGVLLIPINIIDLISECVGNTLKKHWLIITGALLVVGIGNLIYLYMPKTLLPLLIGIWHFINYMLHFVVDYTNSFVIMFLLIGYVSMVFVLWKPENNNKFHLASMVIWLLLSFFISKQFGLIKIPVFILLQLVLIIGFISEVWEIQERLKQSGSDYTLIDSLKFALNKNSKNEVENDDEKPLKKEELSDLSEAESLENKETIKKDPWSLDLFQQKSAQSQHKNAALVITDKGKVHILKKPSTDDLNSSSMHRVRRSFSQPSVGGSLPLKGRTSFLTWRRHPSKVFKTTNGDLASDTYIYTLLWGCGFMILWRNIMFLPIVCIPAVIYLIKHLGLYLGLWSWIAGYCTNATETVSVWCDERYDAILPVPIRGFYKIVIKINAIMKRNARECIDTVASIVVILGLIVFVLCASIFIFVQIYAEAIILVQMTSNVINQTVVHNPELRQLLPPTFDNTVDSILDNAYQYGREGISKAVKSVMSDVEPTKSAKLEKQVLELWDRIYQNWMSSDDAHGPQVTSDAVQKTWNNFLDDLKKTPEMFNLSGIMSFVNQNVGTLMSLVDSVWSIVKGNISLVLGSFSAILSVLLEGGTAVLNFILNLVIFFTALFYLLSSSGELYKPVELMTQMSSDGNRFGLALGDAINGVFTASFKMATFYGMWTWFIHNVFGVKIVYLPSAVAAILGAAPFLGPYLACVPAVLDLWLAQGKSLEAILFAAVQFVPLSIVDATIYAEIKGGHPYLTGLAIAGGIFCLGLEGAIIGPLVLCGLYVAVDLSATLFKETPSEETINLQELSRLQLENI